MDKALAPDATISVLQDADKSVYIFGGISGRGGWAVYEALGLKPSAALTEEMVQAKYYPISLEVLPKFASDNMLLTSETKTLQDYKADPIWGKLEAVQPDRVYLWKEVQSWFHDRSPC